MEFEGDSAGLFTEKTYKKKFVSVVNKQISRLILLMCYVCVVATHPKRMYKKPSSTIGLPGIAPSAIDL